MTATLAALPSRAETSAQRIRRLQRELAFAGLDHSGEITAELEVLAVRLVEAAALTALPPGLRDLYRRAGEQLAATADTAKALHDRAAAQAPGA